MKILALDGGGVFGRVQAQVLSGSDCFKKFDAFVGTSIGAAQVGAIALGMSDVVTTSFFDKNMPIIFKKNLFRSVNLFKSKYSDNGLNSVLKSNFGQMRFGDCLKPCFITAADVGQKSLKVFSSKSFDDKSRLMWEVIRQATAAETYFPSWKGFADGGIYANNPSMVGIAAASRVLGARLEDIEVLSIGTGMRSCNNKTPSNRIDTALWTVRAMLEGSANSMHDYFVRSLPIKRYERVDFVSDQNWKMDDPNSMYYSQRAWARDIIVARDVVKNF